MRPDKIINESRRFDPRSFFYSRTDKRGVIRSGNPFFFDVSGYEASALLGAPHKVVRHPDMPRGFFHLVWDRLQAGEPIVGCVKNLAQDGRYYWVVATISPVDDGYLSVRIGAEGALLEQTQAIYARMLKAEAGGMTPAQSADLMLSELAAAGFPALKDYMIALLVDHMSDDQKADAKLDEMLRLRDFMRGVTESRRALLDTLKTLYLIPTNMRILASRLEPSGGPVSAISDSYKRAAAELMARLNGTGGPVAAAGGDDGLDLVSEALFGVVIAEMLEKAVRQFSREPTLPGIEPAEESRTLSALVRALQEDAMTLTGTMMQGVQHIIKEAENIKRLMAGLDQIRILGEVESGRLRNSDGGLASIMAQLTSFHGLIHTRLTTMSNVAARMQSGVA